MTTEAPCDFWPGLPEVIRRRQADWRVGSVVYQAIVDRFAPPENLAAKAHLYAPPRKLHKWSDLPHKGHRIKGQSLWSHEMAFWGGDLASLRLRLDHICQLGADALYLNPIQHSISNHKYDAIDHGEISPEYGTSADLSALADDLHSRNMRLILDGVFNHIGSNAPRFQQALADAESPWRHWFHLGPQYPHGYRAWNNIQNLPELNLDHPLVRQALFLDAGSPLLRFLQLGADGWRLDTANDLGHALLALIADSVRRQKPDAVVIGEAWNYPEGWCPPLDGVLNMHARQILLELADGHHTGAHTARLLDRMIQDMGIEAALKSWLILDNHDTPRLHTRVADGHMRRILRALQFTLPGCPCIYYGAELDMEGGDDPEQRAAMRWDLATGKNTTLAFYRQLISLRRTHPAMRIGQFRVLDSQRLLAFLRYTDRVADSVFVLVNPTDKAVDETLATREARIMSASVLTDLLDRYQTHVYCGMLAVHMPPKSVRVLVPVMPAVDAGYSPYKRIP